MILKEVTVERTRQIGQFSPLKISQTFQDVSIEHLENGFEAIGSLFDKAFEAYLKGENGDFEVTSPEVEQEDEGEEEEKPQRTKKKASKKKASKKKVSKKKPSEDKVSKEDIEKFQEDFQEYVESVVEGVEEMNDKEFLKAVKKTFKSIASGMDIDDLDTLSKEEFDELVQLLEEEMAEEE